ncbi:hypothetical protein SUDANB21_00684 [Streptomyces sp. enrichment culture]
MRPAVGAGPPTPRQVPAGTPRGRGNRPTAGPPAGSTARGEGTRSAGSAPAPRQVPAGTPQGRENRPIPGPPAGSTAGGEGTRSAGSAPAPRQVPAGTPRGRGNRPTAGPPAGSTARGAGTRSAASAHAATDTGAHAPRGVGTTPPPVPRRAAPPEERAPGAPAQRPGPAGLTGLRGKSRQERSPCQSSGARSRPAGAHRARRPTPRNEPGRGPTASATGAPDSRASYGRPAALSTRWRRVQPPLRGSRARGGCGPTAEDERMARASGGRPRRHGSPSGERHRRTRGAPRARRRAFGTRPG